LESEEVFEVVFEVEVEVEEVGSRARVIAGQTCRTLTRIANMEPPPTNDTNKCIISCKNKMIKTRVKKLLHTARFTIVDSG
jgi:hypothetical protein